MRVQVDVYAVSNTHLKRCGVFENENGAGKWLWERLEAGTIWVGGVKGKREERMCNIDLP